MTPARVINAVCEKVNILLTLHKEQNPQRVPGNRFFYQLFFQLGIRIQENTAGVSTENSTKTRLIGLVTSATDLSPF